MALISVPLDKSTLRKITKSTVSNITCQTLSWNLRTARATRCPTQRMNFTLAHVSIAERAKMSSIWQRKAMKEFKYKIKRVVSIEKMWKQSFKRKGNWAKSFIIRPMNLGSSTTLARHRCQGKRTNALQPRRESRKSQPSPSSAVIHTLLKWRTRRGKVDQTCVWTNWTLSTLHWER